MAVSLRKATEIKIVYALQDIDGGIQCITTASKYCLEVAVKLFSPAARENLFISAYALIEDDESLLVRLHEVSARLDTMLP